MRKTKPEDDKTKPPPTTTDTMIRTTTTTTTTDTMIRTTTSSDTPVAATTNYVPPNFPAYVPPRVVDREKEKEKELMSAAVRGGVFKNGVYYSESELAEQSAITWNPCYWTRERISKWVDEVEHPDTLRSIAKSLSPSNGASS